MWLGGKAQKNPENKFSFYLKEKAYQGETLSPKFLSVLQCAAEKLGSSLTFLHVIKVSISQGFQKKTM